MIVNPQTRACEVSSTDQESLHKRRVSAVSSKVSFRRQHDKPPTLKQLAQSYTSPGEKLGAFSTFGLGGLAGIITVYTTMPIDTVKTRMQSIEASAQYKNSIDCVVKIFKHEGLLTFWSGAVPRLGRLILSGGIVFTM
jgi:hypothetical protein